MHDGYLFDGEKCWVLFAFYLQYNDNFFFAEIHWYISCAKISDIFVKARACLYIFIDTGEDKQGLASAL